MEQDLKSFARKLVRVANTFVALGAAVYFLLNWFLGETDPLRAKLPTRELLALVGGGVLVLNVLRVIYWRPGKRRDYEGPVLSHTEEGAVHVSREAIEAGLRSAGEALAEVTRLRVKVLTPARRKVVVRALYLAPEGVQILELSSRLRKVLAERFHQMVRLDREGRLEIEILFEGFYGKPLAKPVEEREEQVEVAEEPAVPPFTGPRYPIDAGEETA